MKLRLYRSRYGERSTLGDLFINDRWFCYTIEDTDRKLEDNPEAKVYGETAIPRGTYNVVITFSNRFKTELPLVQNVPGFEGIRIHAGNTNADTHGCVLPGSKFAEADGDYMVMNSRATFNKLFEIIDNALDQKDTVTLEVA